MVLKVLRHGNCFDGFASAAVFARFYREHVDPSVTVVHRALRHGAPGPVNSRYFDSDVHAVVDFRYAADERLDWWFDHHRSSFSSADERAHFESAANPQHFWDPTAPSCAGYIARTCAERYGMDLAPLTDLIHWVDIVDAARFPDAHTAVGLEEPILQLVSVLEQLGDEPLSRRVLEALTEGDLQGLAADDEIKARFHPIRDRQQRSLKLLRDVGVRTDDIIFYDLTASPGVVANKFAGYFLEPDVTYVVTVFAQPGRVKLSIGSNPWRPEARRHDIARLCERYGGGGHPFVGGITLLGKPAREGVRIGQEIVTLLQGADPII